MDSIFFIFTFNSYGSLGGWIAYFEIHLCNGLDSHSMPAFTVSLGYGPLCRPSFSYCGGFWHLACLSFEEKNIYIHNLLLYLT